MERFCLARPGEIIWLRNFIYARSVIAKFRKALVRKNKSITRNKPMNCPKCKKEMTVKVKDTSSDFRNGKKYDRVVYWCERDDTWIRIETPKRGKVRR